MTAFAVRVAVAALALGVAQGEGEVGSLQLGFMTPPDSFGSTSAGPDSYFEISIQRDEAGTEHSTTRYIKLYNDKQEAGRWVDIELGTFSAADTVEVSFVDPDAANTGAVVDPAQGSNSGPTPLSAYAPNAAPQQRYSIPFSGFGTPFQFGFSFDAVENVAYHAVCADYDGATGTVGPIIAPSDNFFARQLVLDAKVATGVMNLDYGVGTAADYTVAVADGTGAPVWNSDAMVWPAGGAGVAPAPASLVAFKLGGAGKGEAFVDSRGWARVDPTSVTLLSDDGCGTEQKRVYLVGSEGTTCNDRCATAYKDGGGGGLHAACVSGCKHAHPALGVAYGPSFKNSEVCPVDAAKEDGCTGVECADARLKGCTNAFVALESDANVGLRCAHDALIAKLPASQDGVTTYINWFQLVAGTFQDASTKVLMTDQACADNVPKGTCVDFVCDRGRWVGLDAEKSGGCTTDAIATCAASCSKTQLGAELVNQFSANHVFNLDSVGATATAGTVADVPCVTLLDNKAEGQAQFTCTSNNNGIGWERTGNGGGCKIVNQAAVSAGGGNGSEPEPETTQPFLEADEPTFPTISPEEVAKEDAGSAETNPTVQVNTTANTTEAAAVTTSAAGSDGQAAAQGEDDLSNGELAGLIILIIFIVVIAGVIAWVGYHAYLNRKPKYIYNDLEDTGESMSMQEVSPFVGGATSGHHTSKKQLSTSALQVNLLAAGGAEKPTEAGETSNVYPMATSTNVYPLAVVEDSAYPMAQQQRAQRKPRAPGYSNVALAAAGLAKPEPEPEPPVPVAQADEGDGDGDGDDTLLDLELLKMELDGANTEAAADTDTDTEAAILARKKTMVAVRVAARGGAGDRKSSLAMFAEELGVRAPAAVPQQKARGPHQKTVQIRPKKVTLQQSVKAKESSSDPSKRPVSMSLNTVLGTSQTDQSVRRWNPRNNLKKTGVDPDRVASQPVIAEGLASPELESPEFALEKDGESLRLKSTRRANPLFDAAAETDANKHKAGSKTINNV